MMKRSWPAMLLCVMCGFFTSADAQAPRREVAFTIDDLPMAGEAWDMKEIEATTARLLAPLVAHRIPAIGFVTEGQLLVKGETDARINLLRMWLDAGMTLGNHTFSHVDFNDTSLQQYEDEAIRGEVVTRQLLQERGLSKFYFRYPYNHTGATKERKEAFQRFLKSRGYEVAPFTVQHDDYLFSNVYEEAKRKNDKVLAKHIHTVYLEHLDTMFDYFEQRSRLLLGREVKQVFLIHATALNADCLEEMIGKLKQRGYYFISLEEALRDEAYQIQDDYVGKYGISWLHRWMISLGKELNYRDEPEPPKFVLDLQQAK